MNYQEQLAALEAKKQAKNLSAEQLKNWREILAGMIGHDAFLLSDERIEKLRTSIVRSRMVKT